MIYRILLVCLAFISCSSWGFAQDAKSFEIKADSSRIEAAADSTVRSVMLAADSLPKPAQIKMEFKPDPKKAVLMALVPGLGQIYNRKFWKLPIVYGGLMGCMYAVTWNNRNYQDYSTAYKDIMMDAEEPNRPVEEFHTSWQDFLGVGYDPKEWVTNTNFQTQLKNRKDYYRRYRDLSIIITVGVYALSIIDAYVDAQLFDFDISPDLSMHWEPSVTPQTAYSSRSYGLNCSIKF
ncbi:MAG: DUF5683 domain-containing protein [Parabacteroides sp.]|jgi:hypothetical protein|uniref:DUF5683 domain-containing protein n=1 Tax=Parabacteroides faecalis TaxID=2924040 RepID=A0ABT0C1N1_9BACT|nr:DUF5683 domain-containing protein [Parabacteroides faecalis]MBS7343653.1 hypothetical protein [Parabacteroides sp.]MDY5622965.1 DUF5683 domain-containing protein [Bacteroidales bacterium]CDE65339.1 putative uncharacterized protein [Parabacteroides sp. CAG:409]MCI7285983.1 DUF5683 domain-containing protein [Parabacteroides sp.]MCI7357601.1 DUF5683 domain-containing protein [Parabacteroides sp.]